MLGFHKKKLGRKRDIFWRTKRLFCYEHKPNAADLKNAKLQQALTNAFWKKKPTTKIHKKTDAIVSLTSYGERAQTVHITLQSIFEQTLQPERVVLWLSNDEFNEKNLPKGVEEARNRGVEVLFCENIRSYKKIIPTLKRYPESPIITIDDDIMYPPDFLARLASASILYPNSVVAYRAHRLGFDESNNLLPYKQWHRCVKNEKPSFLIFPTGAGGVWYPRGCFYEQVFDRQTFMRYCPTADDIWLKAMTLKNGVTCAVVPGENQWANLPPFIGDTQEDCLAMSNVNGDNDLQFKAVFDHLDLWQMLNGEVSWGS